MPRNPTPIFQAMLQFCGLETDEVLYNPTTGALHKVDSALGRALQDLTDAERALVTDLARLADAHTRMVEYAKTGMMPDPMWVVQHSQAVAATSARIQEAVATIKVMGPIRAALLAN